MSAATQGGRRPNVIVITCHDLGRHLGCYGVHTVHTPNLDALASSGVRFERAFATASGCSPSRATLATGRYPHSNGVMGLSHPPFNWDLNPHERPVAEILGAAGYETHLFGFQHVSPHPERLGFGRRYRRERILGWRQRAPGRGISAPNGNFFQDRRSDRPFYVEVNLQESHRPYGRDGAMPDEKRGVYVPLYLPDSPESREEMAMLQGDVRQADAAIGNILAALDAARLRDNTLVLFTADHGLAMPRAKCTLYDPGIEIALIMRWPAGGVVGGRVFSELVSNVDVLPTLLQALDIPITPRLQGRSFLPLLRGEPYIARTEVYAEKTFHSYYDPMRAIRTERFKYIRNFETSFAVEVPGDVQAGAIFRAHIEQYHGSQHPAVELYDLENDPLEQHNRAGDAEFMEVELELDDRLWTWIAETEDPLLHGPVSSPSYRAALTDSR